MDVAMHMIRSRQGRITANPTQEALREEDGDEGSERVSTDPWGVTDLPGLNGEPKKLPRIEESARVGAEETESA